MGEKTITKIVSKKRPPKLQTSNYVQAPGPPGRPPRVRGFLNKKQESEQHLNKKQQSEQKCLFDLDSISIFRWFLNENLNQKQQSEQKCLFDIDFQMLLRS